MSSSVAGTLFPVDYDFGTDIASSPAIDDLSIMGTSGGSWNLETDGRRLLSGKKGSILPAFRSHGTPPQPALAENEQLLTSTLEELGDAVAWYVYFAVFFYFWAFFC